MKKKEGRERERKKKGDRISNLLVLHAIPFFTRALHWTWYSPTFTDKTIVARLLRANNASGRLRMTSLRALLVLIINTNNMSLTTINIFLSGGGALICVFRFYYYRDTWKRERELDGKYERPTIFQKN